MHDVMVPGCVCATGACREGHTKCLLLMRVHVVMHVPMTVQCALHHTCQGMVMHVPTMVRCDVDLNTIATVQQACHSMVADMLLSIITRPTLKHSRHITVWFKQVPWSG